MKKSFIFTLCIILILSASPAPAGDCTKGESLFHQAMSESDVSLRIRLLEESVKECKTFNAYYELAKAYEKQEQFKNAETALTNAKTLADGKKAVAKVFSRLGLICEKMGKEDQAVKNYRDSLENYESPKVRERLIILETRQMEQGKTADEIKNTLLEKSRGFQAEPLVLYINFEYDKFDLNSEGVRQAEALGKALIDPVFKGNSFLLIGHTDQQGEETYNQRLSEKRATFLKSWLMKSFSLSSDQIATKGRGESSLLYFGDSEAEHALNRRVEVEIK